MESDDSNKSHIQYHSQKEVISLRSNFQLKGEEELQLQLALAMSREEAEQEESKSKSDDMRLQLALQKSKEEVASGDGATAVSEGDGGFSKSSKSSNSKPSKDLLDLDFGNPVAQPPPPQRTGKLYYMAIIYWDSVAGSVI